MASARKLDLPKCAIPVFFSAPTIDRQGLTCREAGTQSHGPAGKPAGSRAAETNVGGPRSGQAETAGRVGNRGRRVAASQRARAADPGRRPVRSRGPSEPALPGGHRSRTGPRANAPWTMQHASDHRLPFHAGPPSEALGPGGAGRFGRKATFASSNDSSADTFRRASRSGERARANGDSRAFEEGEEPARRLQRGLATAAGDGGDAPRPRLWGRSGPRVRSAATCSARRLAAMGTGAAPPR